VTGTRGTDGGYEAVIGVEVHLQLHTRTKAFCSCAVAFGDPPNTHTCPVCLGMPGALPVLNERALHFALRVAAALRCEIAPTTRFDRKNYFYPDLPKGYQISQYDLPVGRRGHVELPEGSRFAGKRVRIRRVHLEEDAGKLVHDADPDASVVDLNRAGTPLVEIVTEPDLSEPEEVYDYLRELHLVLSHLGVSDCDMEKGSMRCEPNVSVRPAGADTLGTKTEVKNLNSFRHARDALAHEIERQIELVRSGGAVRQETRLFDAERGETRPMRAKEEAHDYRYFPDPDLPPVHVGEALLARVREALPEPPRRRERRYRELGLAEADARFLVQDAALAAYFDAALEGDADPVALAKWILGDVQRELHDRRVAIDDLGVPPSSLAELVVLVARGTVNKQAGREVLSAMIETGGSPASIIESRGLAQIGSEDELGPVVERAISSNPEAVRDVRAGNAKALGALVGFVMRETRGRANGGLVQRMLREKIEAGA